MRNGDVTSVGDGHNLPDDDGHDLHDRDGCEGDGRDLYGLHDRDSDECNSHAKLPSFKEYALSFAGSDINDSDTDVDDSFKETLRTAYNDGTLLAMRKDSENSNKNILLKVTRRGVAGFHQFNSLTDRYSDFFRDYKIISGKYKYTHYLQTFAQHAYNDSFPFSISRPGANG